MGTNENEIANKVAKIISAKKQRTVIIIVIILLLMGTGFFFNSYAGIRADLAISQQNEAALSDSVRVEVTKNGELEASKQVLVTDRRNLKNLNEDLAEELKETKGKVSEITKLIGQIKRDTVYIQNTLITYVDKDSNVIYGLSWEHDTIYSEGNERHLAGVSKFKIDTTGLITPFGTLITRDVIKFDITTGLREKDGNIEIFARSSFPGFETLELNGAIIDPKKHPVIKNFTKKKRFGIGPYVGVGLGINTIPTTNIGLGFQIGVGVSYSLFRF
jgi:hypothetical protein